ncbi:3-dehydroquinate synthase [Psychrosphaera sp. B3R10]|uniref:3-dehydroquinate synthase n=1 Tax=unclassified Psychrosphaera TaxID=2641570 RepID=UPI001C0A234F|nr:MULTISPECIES: 3-dehydroquinate synthase [unclassified Psychrosphaera]MBU2881089.1 3-dehydroquinate synthase [Psychrosphaera sp. I2R16]MBU2990013.1 3-dehydroquinate synthase [Psychrosphaera sp. B3R10]MDO6721204.1 3-dehydroquinate synthase [Psychrosphaera sp. 1_MG-2023]
METLNVSLGERSYPIYIKQGAMFDASLFSQHIKGTKVVIVTNDTLAPIFATEVAELLSQYDVATVTIPDGEAYKTLASYEHIMSFLLSGNYGRDVTLIALGGGVIGDVTGFVAATYQRGVDFIQVPTTLLSQVDSSVGGKTAVNHPLGKNMIGAFYQPKAVIIDIDSLSSLPDREFSAGMAEVIKYGILGDIQLFEYLEVNLAEISAKVPSVLSYIIKQCCQNKADIVAQDEKESGVRALLNLGHTFGHAIEAEMGYGNWLHGEAVAVGMVQASELAKLRGWLSDADVNRIVALNDAFSLPSKGPAQMSYEQYIPHMKKDKKVQAQTIRFVLPKHLGEAILVTDVTESELKLILQ